jgi:hypothetical protein
MPPWSGRRTTWRPCSSADRHSAAGLQADIAATLEQLRAAGTQAEVDKLEREDSPR